MIVEGENISQYSVPIESVDAVVVGRRGRISMPMIFALLEHGCQISYVDFRGRVLGVLGGERGSLERLQRQMECFSKKECQLELVKYVLRRKIRAQSELIKSYAKREHNEEAKDRSKAFRDFLALVETQQDVDSLRGVEGAASQCYFDSFRYILPEGWEWNGRNRRPPRDPINSMLGYGYAFLEREVRYAIEGAKLDPRIGFFHSNNGRKDSLVYDIMEIFRQSVIDHFIMRIINYKTLTPDDFYMKSGKGCLLSNEARGKWISQYEKYMNCPFKRIGGVSVRDYIRQEVFIFADSMWKTGDMYCMDDTPVTDIE